MLMSFDCCYNYLYKNDISQILVVFLKVKTARFAPCFRESEIFMFDGFLPHRRFVSTIIFQISVVREVSMFASFNECCFINN